MGTDSFHQAITTGLTPDLVWTLFTLALAFMLGWVFKGRLMDILGWFWFKASPFDEGFVIYHDTNSGIPVMKQIESYSIKQIRLRVMDDKGRKTDKVCFLPMSEVKAVSAGWVLEQTHSGDKVE